MKICVELEGEASVLLGRSFLRLDTDSALDLMSKITELSANKYIYGVFIHDVNPNLEVPYKIYKT